VNLEHHRSYASIFADGATVSQKYDALTATIRMIAPWALRFAIAFAAIFLVFALMRDNVEIERLSKRIAQERINVSSIDQAMGNVPQTSTLPGRLRITFRDTNLVNRSAGRGCDYYYRTGRRGTGGSGIFRRVRRPAPPQGRLPKWPVAPRCIVNAFL
jgi:hypothetical protein